MHQQAVKAPAQARVRRVVQFPAFKALMALNAAQNPAEEGPQELLASLISDMQ